MNVWRSRVKAGGVLKRVETGTADGPGWPANDTKGANQEGILGFRTPKPFIPFLSLFALLA